MKETSFIEQNKAKWAAFEKLYASGEEDPEQLADLYMDITNDLSYAQTFYKRRTVRVYLNQLSQKIFSGVQKHKREPLRRIFDVLLVSLPMEIYRSRKNLLFALICFLLYTAIGVFSTQADHSFPRMILGDGYVDMTLENIKQGNPLAVYETNDQMSMFLMITTNNLKVSFLTFFAGFFLTIGTHMLMFSNGVMLGSFQYFFHLKGLLLTSFLGIWIHGAFEISSIVIAGGAGITAGNGLLFPGSYTRMQSLRLSSKRGAKLMLSLVPFIFLAGFLESFVTHNYQLLPDWSKWALILFSFTVILFLYVIYPQLVARKYPELIEQEALEEKGKKEKVELFRIRSIGEIWTVSVQTYLQLFGKLMTRVFQLVFPICLILMLIKDFFHPEFLKTTYWFDWTSQINILTGGTWAGWIDILMACGWLIALTLTVCLTYWLVQEIIGESKVNVWSFLRKHGRAVLMGLGLPVILMLALPWEWHVFSIFIFPLLLLPIPAAVFNNESTAGKRLKRGFRYSASSYGRLFLLILLLSGFLFLVLQPVAFVFSIHETNEAPIMRDLLDVLADFIARIAQWFTDEPVVVSNMIRQLVYSVILLMVVPFISLLFLFTFLSETEKQEAISLKSAFKTFGRSVKNAEEIQE